MKINNKILLIFTLLSIQTLGLQTLAQEVKKDSRIPSLKDGMALMQSICGVGNVSTKKGKIYCTTCPSFTGYSSGDGSLTSVVYGSFTKAGTQEALVDLGDCEPHAANFGGSVLLRRSNNGWFRVRYESGLRSNICLKKPNRTGLDSLICQTSYMGQGYLSEWLGIIEIGAAKTKNTPLLNVGSNIGSCNPPYSEVRIKDFSLRDTNKDQRPDLIVKVSEAREANGITRSNDNKCEPRFPKAKQHQLTFLFNGQSFSPTATTSKLIRKWK